MRNHPTRSARFSTAALLAAGVTLGVGAFAPAARAQVVTTLADDGSAGSLRSQLDNATAGQTITFQDGLDGTISLDAGRGALEVARGLTVDATGRSIVIDGGGNDRVLEVFAGSGNEVRLTNLTLRGGSAVGGAGGTGIAGGGGGGGGGVGAGGAVYGESGVIILDGTRVLDSAAEGGDGGDGALDATSGGDPGTGTGAGGTGGLNASLSGGAGGPGSGTDRDGENGDFGSGGGGGGASSSNPGDGGAGAGEAGGGVDGTAAQGGGGGGGSALGGGVFLTRDATLVLAGDGELFSGNTVSEGQGGLPPMAGGAMDGQDGGARGPSVAGQGRTDIELRVADGDRLVVDTDGFASIDNIGSGSSTAPPLNEDLNFIKTGPGAFTLIDSDTFMPAGVVAGDSSYDLFVNEGRFNPGGFDSVGTTDVSGDFTQADDAELDIEFGGDGVDRVSVAGAASLDGGVNFIELSSGVTTDQPLEFLSASGGVTGTFDDVDTVLLSDTQILSAAVSYDADSAFVTFDGVDILADFAGDDPLRNREIVGELLNDVASGDLGDGNTRAALVPAFNALLDADDLDRAVLSQANTTASAALAAVPDNLILASGVALARLDQGAAGFTDRRRRLASRNADLLLAQADIRPAPAPGATQAEPGVAEPAQPVYLDEPTAVDPASATLPADAGAFAPLDGGPALFAQALGAFSDVEGDNAAPGQDSQTYGVAFGGDWAVEDWNAVLGVFAAFSETETGVDGLGDDFKTDAFQIGLYGAKRFNEHLVVNGTGSAAFLDFESERPTTLGTAEGDADGFAVGATLEALYDLPLGRDFIVSPLVGIETYFVDRDGYTESGAGALNLDVDDASGEYLTSIVGVQLATAVELEALGDLRVSPMLRLGWSHQYLDREGTTASAFAVAPDQTFTTRSAARDRDALRIGAALEFGPGDSDDWALFGRYTGDIAGNGDSHALRVGLRLAF